MTASGPSLLSRLLRGRGAAPRFGDALACAALGLVARVVVVVWAAGRFPPADDGHFYHVIATRIAEGHGYTWLWPDGTVTYAAHYPVGYPAIIGGLYALFGEHPVVAMAFNAALGTLAVLAVHQVAASVATRRGAVLAALLVALHPALVFYTPALMTEGVVAALIALAAWLVVRARRADAPRGWWVALGLVLGATTMVRPQSLLLAPLFGALACSGRTPREASRPWMRRLRGALVASLVALAVCLPWTARNCARMGRCVFVSANGGWNLLIGAGPGATGTWVPIERAGIPPRCRNVFDEAEKDACFGSAALQQIARHPGHFIGLMPAKLAGTFDYSGAPGWYLHSSNPRAFDFRDKLRLGVIETVWERLEVLLALLALALWPAPRRRARRAVAALAGVFLFLHAAWVAYLGMAVCAVVAGRALSDHPPAALAAGTVALTAATHAVFFGSGRYSIVCFTLISALAGSLFLRRPGRAPPAPAGASGVSRA